MKTETYNEFMFFHENNNDLFNEGFYQEFIQNDNIWSRIPHTIIHFESCGSIIGNAFELDLERLKEYNKKLHESYKEWSGLNYKKNITIDFDKVISEIHILKNEVIVMYPKDAICSNLNSYGEYSKLTYNELLIKKMLE